MATSIRTLLSIVVFATGCYQSPVPISTQAAPYDPALVGTWQSAEDADDRMSVLQFDNGYYYVEMPWHLGSADTTRLRARAYLSEIDGTTFVNVQDIQGADRSYTFFKLTRLSGNTISLEPLKDMPKFVSSAELSAYLRAHSNDRGIYDNRAVFSRAGS